jgi:hypothetical protein
MEAFSGVIVLAKTGLLYKMGLAVVAFAMVLLPAIYVGLIVLAAYSITSRKTRGLSVLAVDSTDPSSTWVWQWWVASLCFS